MGGGATGGIQCGRELGRENKVSSGWSCLRIGGLIGTRVLLVCRLSVVRNDANGRLQAGELLAPRPRPPPRALNVPRQDLFPRRACCVQPPYEEPLAAPCCPIPLLWLPPPLLHRGLLNCSCGLMEADRTVGGAARWRLLIASLGWRSSAVVWDDVEASGRNSLAVVVSIMNINGPAHKLVKKTTAQRPPGRGQRIDGYREIDGCSFGFKPRDGHVIYLEFAIAIQVRGVSHFLSSSMSMWVRVFLLHFN